MILMEIKDFMFFTKWLTSVSFVISCLSALLCCVIARM